MDGKRGPQLLGKGAPDGASSPDAAVSGVPATGAVVADLVGAVRSLRPGADSAALIDQLRALEDLKSAASSAQARLTAAFDTAQRRAQAEQGVPVSEQGRGVAGQVALARRESPARGSRFLGLARALVMEMPRTLDALSSGRLNEWRATLLVKETACLNAADRCAVDEELAPDTGTFDGAGDKAIIAAARKAAYRRDPRAVTKRADRDGRGSQVHNVKIWLRRLYATPGSGELLFNSAPAARNKRARRPAPRPRHSKRRTCTSGTTAETSFRPPEHTEPPYERAVQCPP